MTDQLESFWVPSTEVRADFPVPGFVPGAKVKVHAGPHKGKLGHVHQFDGLTNMVQVRVGDPEAWKGYDADTQRMLDQLRKG